MSFARPTSCELVDPDSTHCGWCSKTLRGKQVNWCSRHCNRMFVANHRWTQAKQEAKKEVTWFLCANANWAGDPAPWAASGGPEGCLVFTQKPEVNHLEPIRGAHGTWGCHHHAIGLEVLCRPCHLKVTARQRAEGKFS